jgi:hypothetical protein
MFRNRRVVEVERWLRGVWYPCQEEDGNALGGSSLLYSVRRRGSLSGGRILTWEGCSVFHAAMGSTYRAWLKRMSASAKVLITGDVITEVVEERMWGHNGIRQGTVYTVVVFVESGFDSVFFLLRPEWEAGHRGVHMGPSLCFL